MSQPIKTDLSQKAEAIMRLHQASNAYFERSSMFSPGDPPNPAYGDDDPHLYEYRPGINLITTPRMGYGVLPFSALRALGTACKEIRLNIEQIKREIRGLEWEIVPSRKADSVGVGDSEIKTVVNFWESPDHVNDFDAWLNMLIEELLVTDAVTLYPNHDDGEFSLELIDGTTVKPLVDMRGRTPKPPIPAYLQVLHGVPSTHYPANRLLYKPLNTKVYTPYGDTPTEWILTAINTAIRKDAQAIAHYTDGNIPGAFGFLPDDWTPEQIQVWSEYFDALMAGDVGRASKIVWLPGGNGSNNPVYPFQQNNVDNVEVNKYLMQVACWAFGNNPAEFGIIPGEGLGGKGFMQGTQSSQMRSMTWPITGYLSSMFNLITRKYLNRPDVRFQWVGLDPVPDKKQMAEVDGMYVEMGIYDKAYVQDRLGVPHEFRPGYQTPAPAPAVDQSPYFERAVKAELDTWRGKVMRAMKKGWSLPEFRSDIIPADLHANLSAGLKKASGPDEVARAFEQAEVMPLKPDPSATLKMAAERETDAALREYFDGLRQRILQEAAA